MLFYFQLKNLIEPLTPQNIPHSVEQLEKAIDKNTIINKLLYQQLLSEKNLENYVFTKKIVSLNDYYMNNTYLSQLLEKSKPFYEQSRGELETKLNDLQLLNTKIINAMQQNNTAYAMQLIISHHYSSLTQNIKKILSNPSMDASANEAAVVDVKLATKHITHILQSNLRMTLIIFFDAVLASLILVFFSIRAISKPIDLLRSNIENLNIVTFTTPINPKLLQLKGEIGDLARSFNVLFNKLRTTTVLKDDLLTEVEFRKQIEKKLKILTSNLTESNRDLDQFAYAASHDLRAPLRAIENLATWIEEDCYQQLPEESQKHFQLIKKRVHRLEALITGMLEYSRVGKITGTLAIINLNQLLTDIVDNLSPPEHIQIALDQVMPIFKSNKIALTQVFLNLINNAIKYNDKAQGHISIGFKKLKYFYQFYVTDNGKGIESQFYSRIFEIFETLESRDVIESSGIGLAIVKKIILKMGGKIWLDSVVGQGTTFYFTWPKEFKNDKS